MYYFEQELNFNKKDVVSPLIKELAIIGIESLDSKQHPALKVELQIDKVSIDASRFDIFGLENNYNFTKTKLSYLIMSARNDHPFNQNIILWCEVGLSNTLTIHKKSLYTVFDLLGDVGGLLDLFTLFVAFFLSKYNHSLFIFNAANNMFNFSTRDNSNSPPETFPSFLFQSFCSCLPTCGSNSKIKQPPDDSIDQDAAIRHSDHANEQTRSLNLKSPAEAISFCEEKITE